MKNIPRAIHTDRVSLYRGAPIKGIRTDLRKACIKAGVPESVIMEITGHSNREMFDRYNTIDEDDTRKAVNQRVEFLQLCDQNVD